MKDKTIDKLGIFCVASLIFFILLLIGEGYLSLLNYVPIWIQTIILIYYFPGGILTWLIAIYMSET